MKKVLASLLLAMLFALGACAPAAEPVEVVEPPVDVEVAVEAEAEAEAESEVSAEVQGINSPADLEMPGVRIAVQNATTGHTFVQENLPEAELLVYDSYVDVIQAILAGHADAVVMDSEPARNFVARNEGAIRQLDELLTSEYYGIALQLDSPYTELFDEAIDVLRDASTLYTLIDYWVNEDPAASRYTSPEGVEHPNGVLLMGTSADFPPFEFYEGPDIVGLDPDIARAIGDMLGYEIEIIDMDFGTLILALQTGQVDFVMAGMTVTEERLEQVDFTQGYFLSGQSIIVPIQ